MKIQFTALLKKFKSQGEKTGWTYFEVPAEKASAICPGNKKGFRVKGSLDKYPLKQVALIPMGNGDFIMPVNADMRKATGKKAGDTVRVTIQADHSALPVSDLLLQCMQDEPSSLAFFKTLTPSHQQYFFKWVEDAKTQETKAKRVALAVNSLARKMGYGEMLRYQKEQNALLKDH